MNEETNKTEGESNSGRVASYNFLGRTVTFDEDSNEYMMLQDLEFRGDTCNINLWYPDVPENKIRKIEIGLLDVRAADSIRIWYDKKRDGYVIEQASTFEWDGDDEECDSDWQEVAFVRAWAREKKAPK